MKYIFCFLTVQILKIVSIIKIKHVSNLVVRDYAHIHLFKFRPLAGTSKASPHMLVFFLPLYTGIYIYRYFSFRIYIMCYCHLRLHCVCRWFSFLCIQVFFLDLYYVFLPYWFLPKLKKKHNSKQCVFLIP